MGVHAFWGLHMAPPGPIRVIPGQGTHIFHWLSLLRAAQQGSRDGPGGVSLSPPPCWQGSRGTQESEAEPWFVAGNLAGPA